VLRFLDERLPATIRIGLNFHRDVGDKGKSCRPRWSLVCGRVCLLMIAASCHTMC
jgi:hypothetical protein